VGEARAAGLKARDLPKKKVRRPRGAEAAEEFEREAPEPEPTEAIPNPALFERLRALRRKLADERKVPAFVVFSDRTLQDMAAKRPRTRDEFLEVHGVGQRKLEEYGEAFLAELQKD
jgi:ATP-dependent DNA helicase RecQ